MKLLTLNTHSLIEENYLAKLQAFVDQVSEMLPDVIALQEVNQSTFSAPVSTLDLPNFTPCEERTVIKQDNHALALVRLLSKRGIDYYFTWAFIKIGYGRYEEGIALLSRKPIEETKVLTVSKSSDASDWRVRRVIGIRQKSGHTWYFSVHLGWWEDEIDPFASQWNTLSHHLTPLKSVFLMGDFNADAKRKNEGYDLMLRSGFSDTHTIAKETRGDATVCGKIDGWGNNDGRIRIDYILSRPRAKVLSSHIVFDGKGEPIVSDHFGVLVKIEGSEKI